jgi:hypothetical protein
MDQIALRVYEETSFKPDPKLSLEIVLVLASMLRVFCGEYGVAAI